MFISVLKQSASAIFRGKESIEWKQKSLVWGRENKAFD
jgi:hypothetical protein